MKNWKALAASLCLFVSAALLGSTGQAALKGNPIVIAALAAIGFVALAALIIWLALEPIRGHHE